MSKKFAVMPDGTRILVRAAYRAVDFTVPAGEVERLGQARAGYGGADLLDEHDGELSMYRRVRDLERDGKTWALLQHPGEYALEVELTRGTALALRCLPPLEAWALALELDRAETRYPIAVEESFELPAVTSDEGDRGTA